MPAARDVKKDGFTAHWRISDFSSNTGGMLRSCEEKKCYQSALNAFGVGFIQAVDAYSQTTRAIKYGVLFIGLTFTAFFFFETFKRLAVHPIQYGLVGMALAVFFLLLIALSEHLAFALAYGISATACILLLASYISAVLRSVAWGTGFSGGLATLYGTLNVLLQSEDNALLLGSLLIFAILASIMLLTRNIDWYRLNLPTQSSRSL